MVLDFIKTDQICHQLTFYTGKVLGESRGCTNPTSNVGDSSELKTITSGLQNSAVIILNKYLSSDWRGLYIHGLKGDQETRPQNSNTEMTPCLEL